MIPLQVLLLVSLPLVLLWLRSPRTTGGKATPAPIDIGMLFACIVATYGVLPLIGLSLAFAGVGSMQDQRLGNTLPDVKEVEAVGWLYVLFLAGFVAAYGLGRRIARAPAAIELPRPKRADVVKAVLLFAAVNAGTAAIRFAYGIGSGDDYLDSYAVVQNQPLLVQQLLGVLTATDLAIAMLLIVTAIGCEPRWHGWMALFVALQLGLAVVGGGSRTYAFQCGLAYIVARSLYGPRLRWPTMALIGSLALVAFLAIGAVRQTRLDGEEVTPLGLLQGGEFCAFFYNGLDLRERAEDVRSPELSTALYLVDLLRLLPRQIVGDAKVDPAAFYASTFYPEYYDAGGAYAFGAIAESALGFGAPEALLRGALLGLAYGGVRRLVQGRRVSLAKAFVYTWFVVMAYQGLRDTTFTTFPRFVFQVLPVLVVMRALAVARPPRNAAGGGTSPQFAAPPLRSGQGRLSS